MANFLEVQLPTGELEKVRLKLNVERCEARIQVDGTLLVRTYFWAPDRLGDDRVLMPAHWYYLHGQDLPFPQGSSIVRCDVTYEGP